MGYPIEKEVADRLEEAGFSARNEAIRRNLATATRQWEEGTGYKPFCAAVGAVATERNYRLSAEGSLLLDLKAGAVQVNSVSWNGRTLTEGRDYLLLPEQAPYEGEPYTMIRFSGNLGWSSAHAMLPPIVVTAVWAYCANDAMPGDAADAICSRAAELTARPLLGAAAAGEDGAGRLKSVKDGDFERQWDTSTAAKERRATVDEWAATWESAVEYYRLAVIV